MGLVLGLVPKLRPAAETDDDTAAASIYVSLSCKSPSNKYVALGFLSDFKIAEQRGQTVQQISSVRTDKAGDLYANQSFAAPSSQ